MPIKLPPIYFFYNMLATIQYSNTDYRINLSLPIDISLPIRHGNDNVNAFHIPQPEFKPITVGNYTGAVAAGAGSNCQVLTLTPHGNGTHTECIGHITKEPYTINKCLTNFWYVALVISVRPFKMENDDYIILKEEIIPHLQNTPAQALVIRTLPNTDEKTQQNYSGTNPTYLHRTAAKLIQEAGIQHLLIDLPSIDREEDGGNMLAHKAFWNYPEAPKWKNTITELIYVPDNVGDGLYLLNMQIAPLETDASPAKPILYRIL